MPGTAFSDSDRLTCGRPSRIVRASTVSIDSGRSTLSRSTRVAVTVTCGPVVGAEVEALCACTDPAKAAAAITGSMPVSRLLLRVTDTFLLVAANYNPAGARSAHPTMFYRRKGGYGGKPWVSLCSSVEHLLQRQKG